MRKFTRLFAIAGALVMAAAMSMTGAKEAKAQCNPLLNDVNPFLLNCLANGSPDISIFNFGAGFFNGSGNANHVFGIGPELNVQVFNTWLGLANGSGNANIIFSTPSAIGSPAVNIAALNFEAGIANGSGNANVLLADEHCVLDPAGGLDCDNADSAVNVSLLNHYTGVLNGSLNGNNIGTGSATNIDIENFAHGVGNLSGNGNVVGNCEFFGPNDPAPPALDPATESEARSAGGLLRCKKTGDASSTSINNTAFGNLNGTGNGNALGGLAGDDATAGNATSVMTNNRLFGDLNGFGNGNGFGDGGSGSATLDNNFVSGNGSASFNGNGNSGFAEIVDNRVMGDGSLSGNGNAEGSPGDFEGDGNVTLRNNTVIGNFSLSGNPNGTYENNIILGDRSGGFAEGGYANNTIIGHDSGNGFAAGAQNNFIGGNNAGNGITGSNNVAIGNGAGNGLGNDDTAVGARATVTADHSTALGADAVAYLPNQFVMGTSRDTYKAPGITSGLSRARQSGPLEVVTSDATGNLATDGGQIFQRLDENRSGVALALAVVNPDLTRDERFGISANYANFDGASAFGMGLQGVVGHDWITKGDRVAITGGWGVGFEDGRGDDVYGGRVGAQWTWGHSPVAAVAPLKLN